MLIIIATLATTEVSAGAVAKADQKRKVLLLYVLVKFSANPVFWDVLFCHEF